MYGWERNATLISIQTTRDRVGSPRSDCVRSAVAKVAGSRDEKLDLSPSRKNKILYINNINNKISHEKFSIA